jgi:hypothetical protein
MLPGFVRRRAQRHVLLDVGANGFYGSAKVHWLRIHFMFVHSAFTPYLLHLHSQFDPSLLYPHVAAEALIDLYEPYHPFDLVVMLEPDAWEMEVPADYEARYQFENIAGVARTGIRSAGANETTADWNGPSVKLRVLDIVAWIQQNISPHDSFVLKYDVDELNEGKTIEWGFLSDLVHSGAIHLVDELFIELHFWYPQFEGHFRHRDHRMQQAFSVQKQLRDCGVVVHQWP